MGKCYTRSHSPNLFLLFVLFFIAGPLCCQPTDLIADLGRIRVASCQFPVSANIGENARWIIEQMEIAHDSGAQVVHFPECALSGYPGVDLKSLEDFDWNDLQNRSDSIMERAKELKLWVILGSIHPLGEGFKPMNSLYVIDPSGRIVDRYDKRFCTTGDLEYFSAGDHFSVIDICGIRCGLLICFDVRFPELYREYKKLDVDVIFQSFYNARQKPGGIHPRIMPLTSQARAATNHIYMCLSNSSSPSSWPCHLITPDGLIRHRLEPDYPGVLISQIDLSEDYYDASRDFREDALNGKLSSEDPPVHPRNSDRTTL